MSQSIRFIGFAILTWAGVRAISLGLIPGAEGLALEADASQLARPLPPIPPTRLPPTRLPPIEQLPAGIQPQQAWAPHQFAGLPYLPYPVYTSYPVYLPAAAPSSPGEVHVYGTGFERTVEAPQLAAAGGPAPQFHAGAPVPSHQSTPSFEQPALRPGFDRLSLSSWATMRNKGGPDSLAGGGTLGGSEAGSRLMWRFSPSVAATLRASAPINSQRGAEGALGIRYQPFANLPVAVTLERRHAFRDYGQSAFALFAEGGVYGRPLPWQSTLDGYFQAGVVDFNNPDWFADAQAAVTRPVWRNLSAGVGVWGAAQPGLNRIDVGPRASLRLGRGMRAHVDYRLNVAGNALPGSGTVVTIAGDF